MNGGLLPWTAPLSTVNTASLPLPLKSTCCLDVNEWLFSISRVRRILELLSSTKLRLEGWRAPDIPRQCQRAVFSRDGTVIDFEEPLEDRFDLGCVHNQSCAHITYARTLSGEMINAGVSARCRRLWKDSWILMNIRP